MSSEGGTRAGPVRWDQPPEVESGVKGPSQPSLNPFILQVGVLRPRGEFEYVL